LLLGSNPKTATNPDRYIMKQKPMVEPQQAMNGQPGTPSAAKPSSPSANNAGKIM